jgi:ribosome assembly protein RRB1
MDVDKIVEKRKIIKVKKTVQSVDRIMDDGEVIELGSEEEYEDDIIDSGDDSGEVVEAGNDAEWEDVGSDDEEMKEGAATKFWDPKDQPLKEDEELVYDSSAYIMLHRAKVEWPCLSIDVLLRDRIRAPGADYFPS